jgi:ParB family chromosome partitioning protein
MTEIALPLAIEIALNALVASKNNVRRIKPGVSVEDLAEDIARRGLLQSLSVHRVLDETDEPTGTYAVTAGGRRLAALKRLVAEGRLAKDAPIPCIIRDGGIETEDSLAENVMREALHPLDQFRAFKSLAETENLSVEEIAARFFVTPHVVRQRLKLAAASPDLLTHYEAGALTLDQLMAFCVTGDHARQEQIYEQIRQGYNSEPYHIRRLITEGAVKGNDRRVLFVGSEAYEASGGITLRDLFSEDGGGWYQDVALLDRLATEKLAAETKAIAAEGWKWVETAIQFPYGYLNGLTRLNSEPAPVTEEDQARYDAAVAEYTALSEDYEGEEELPEEIDQRMGELEAVMAGIDERPALYNSSEIGHAGAFVSIEHDGRLRIERGFVRSEDRAALRAASTGTGAQQGSTTGSDGEATHAGASTNVDEPEETETASRLSDRLVAELTAHRTLALREAVAENPDTALLAMTHALVLKTFYRFARSDTCLEVDVRSASLASQAPEIGDTDLAARMDQRQSRWQAMLPTNPGDLWSALVSFDPDSLAGLFAFCVAQSVNAVEMPHIRRTGELAHADAIAAHVGLDMKRHWTATAKAFFNKVTKAQILSTVREVKGDASAQMIDHLKKADMAVEAERLMAGSNWLPDPLKVAQDIVRQRATPVAETLPPTVTDPAPDSGDEADDVDLPAFLTEALAQSAAHAIAAE